MKSRNSTILKIALALHLILGWALLTNVPVVSPDEAVYADIAQTITQTGKASTTLWQTLIPGIDTAALWNPPVFFTTLSYWSRFLGTSLFTQRLLSLFLGAGILILIHRLFLLLDPKVKPHLEAVLLVGISLDFLFLRASHVSRPEIMVMFWSLLAVNCMLEPKPIVFKTVTLPRLFITGFFLSLALLTHPIALVFAIACAVFIYINYPKHRLFSLAQFVLGLSILPVLWLVSILPHRQILVDQITLAAARKNQDDFWFFLFTRSQTPLLQISFAAMQLSSLFILLRTWKVPNKKQILPFILLIAGWFVAIYGRMLWYSAYIAPYFYISTAAAIVLETNKTIKRLLVATVVVIIGLNSLNILQSLQQVGFKNHLYDEYALQVAQAIPDNSTVFLMAEPDPYFGFKKLNKNIKLYEFPVLPVDLNTYQSLLNQTDYIVYNANLNEVLFNSFLDSYLAVNAASFYPINQDNLGFHAIIYQLKPQHDRVSVISP